MSEEKLEEENTEDHALLNSVISIPIFEYLKTQQQTPGNTLRKEYRLK
jgi:hypothetical protein